jgi:hypothetical protein
VVTVVHSLDAAADGPTLLRTAAEKLRPLARLGEGR